MRTIDIKSLYIVFVISGILVFCRQLQSSELNNFLAYLQSPYAKKKRLELYYEHTKNSFFQGYASVQGTKNRCSLSARELSKVREFIRAHKAYMLLDVCLVWGTPEKECCVECYKIAADN